SQIRVAFSSIASNTGFNSPDDELITINISDVAVSCSRASSNSRVSRAVLVSLLGKPRRPAAFGAEGLRRRVFTALLPALERRFIAPPCRLGKGSYQLKVAPRKGWVSVGVKRPMSALGQNQTHAVQQAMSAIPPIATAKADMAGLIQSPRRRGRVAREAR